MSKADPNPKMQGNTIVLLKKHSIDYDVRTFGVREVELAVEGWCWVTNADSNPQAIESARRFANPEGTLETHVEKDVAYSEVPMAQVIYDQVGVYNRGENIEPRVPKVLIGLARDLQKKADQRSYLLDYARRLRRTEHIAGVSHYVARKLEELGLTDEAGKVEMRLRNI